MNVSKYPVDKFKDKTIVITEDFLYNKNNLQFSKMHYQYIDKVILSRGAILDRIEKLAENIVKDYIDKTVYFLVVLKGAIVFGTHLAEQINNILKINKKKTTRVKTKMTTPILKLTKKK